MRTDGDSGDALRAFLAERDVACPGCGYNLRNLTKNVCPECARQFFLAELQTERGNPRRAIPGLVCLSGALACCVLALTYRNQIGISWPIWVYIWAGANALFVVPLACMALEFGRRPRAALEIGYLGFMLAAAVLLLSMFVIWG
jgi:hypothetical protein